MANSTFNNMARLFECQPVFSLIGKVCVKNIDPYLEELKVLVNVTKERVSIIF